MQKILIGFSDGASVEDKRRAKIAFTYLFEGRNNITKRSRGFFTGIHFVESLYDDYSGIYGNHFKLQFLDNLILDF